MNDIHLIKQDIYPLQSAPVSKLSFTSFLSEKERQYCRQFKDYEEIRSSDGPYVSKTYDLFANKDLYLLKNKFHKAIILYVELVLRSPSLKFKLTGSWLTKNTNNSSHHPHTHSNTMLSAVTYFNDSVKAGEKLPGIVFEPKKFSGVFPTFQFNFDDVEVTDWNIFNCGTYTIRPEHNDVIVFPGHLAHASEVSHTERYCIGANYFITGDVGSYINKNKLFL